MGSKIFDKAKASQKQIEIYQDFSGGINTELADSATKDNQFRKLINFDMDKAGSISKRPGLKNVIPQMEEDIKSYLQKWVIDELRVINGYEKNPATGDDDLNRPIKLNINDLVIQDSYEFYDGMNHVFNFITNWGVIVYITKADMSPWPTWNWDQVSKKDYINEHGKRSYYYHHSKNPIRFYPDMYDLKSGTYCVNKIGNYNGAFTWFKTFAAGILQIVNSPAKRPIKSTYIHTWNPIEDPSITYDPIFSLDPNTSSHVTVTLSPNWILARDDDHKKVDSYQVSGKQSEDIKSKPRSMYNFFNSASASKYPLKSLTQKAPAKFFPQSIDPNKQSNDVKVEYEPGRAVNEAASFSVYSRNRTLKGAWIKEYSIPLVHQTGKVITDNAIDNIVWSDGDTITVYLNIALEYRSDWEWLTEWDEEKSAINFFWVRFREGQASERIQYPKRFFQQYNKSKHFNRKWPSYNAGSDGKISFKMQTEDKKKFPYRSGYLIHNAMGIPYKTIIKVKEIRLDENTLKFFTNGRDWENNSNTSHKPFKMTYSGVPFLSQGYRGYWPWPDYLGGQSWQGVYSKTINYGLSEDNQAKYNVPAISSYTAAGEPAYLQDRIDVLATNRDKDRSVSSNTLKNISSAVEWDPNVSDPYASSNHNRNYLGKFDMLYRIDGLNWEYLRYIDIDTLSYGFPFFSYRKWYNPNGNNLIPPTVTNNIRNKVDPWNADAFLELTSSYMYPPFALAAEKVTLSNYRYRNSRPLKGSSFWTFLVASPTSKNFFMERNLMENGESVGKGFPSLTYYVPCGSGDVADDWWFHTGIMAYSENRVEVNMPSTSTLYTASHLKTKDNKLFGFANSFYQVLFDQIQDNSSLPPKPVPIDVPAAKLIENDFEVLTLNKWESLKDLTRIGQTFWRNEKEVDISHFFSKDPLALLLERILDGQVSSLNMWWSPDAPIQEREVRLTTPEIKQMIQDMVDHFEDKETGRFTKSPWKAKYYFYKRTNPNLEEFYFVDLYWVQYNDRWDEVSEKLICSVNVDELNNGWELQDNEIEQKLSSFYFRINYNYFSGKFAASALSFNQELYVKPTLFDLKHLWYNFSLFSQFQDSTHPDIYSPQKHPVLSKELIKLPEDEIIDRVKPIQLYGLVPVNNVILEPGKQRFQLLHNKQSDGVSYDDLLMAITVMTVSDYNNLILQEDYSTSNEFNEIEASSNKAAKVTPPWKKWSEWMQIQDPTNANNFVPGIIEYDPKDPSKPANNQWSLIDLNIPRTTEPLMVLVQVCKRIVKGAGSSAKDVTDIKTISETRIEFQATSSTTNYRLDTQALHNEFMFSTGMTTYASHFVLYGNNNKLFFNEIPTLTYFPLSRVIELKTPEAVKATTVFQNKLIISTENNKFYIGGSSFDSASDPFYLKDISSDTGLLAHKSEAPVGNNLFFLDANGIKALKNLFGTADKEFAFEQMDTLIKSQVSPDRDAIGISFQNKYYINFPNYNYTLVYNTDYKAWVMYESDIMSFSSMFVWDGQLYSISKKGFNLFKFDEDTYVDNWKGEYRDGVDADGTTHRYQDGIPINCVLQTKNLDQTYNPHRKKYDWALIEADSSFDPAIINGELTGVYRTQIIPYVLVDDDLINYDFDIESSENGLYRFVPKDPNAIILRVNSTLGKSALVGNSRLGDNTNSLYHLPIQRKGNNIAFLIEHNDATPLHLKSISLRYSIAPMVVNKNKIS